MAAPLPNKNPRFEQRLDELREEALAKGTVTGQGVAAAGGPVPPAPITPETLGGAGYYGLPVVKPPVWKWMIAAYFFVGGLAGMSALIAACGVLKHQWDLVRWMIWAAAVGAGISAVLLIWDLGRPMRFINMLRVFKLQSPMSLGSWILSFFGAFAIPGVILVEFDWQTRLSYPVIHLLGNIAVFGAAFAGIFLATYTGALVAATSVPAWHAHRGMLPFHFGIAALGSAVGFAELGGYRLPALQALGYFAAVAQTLVMIWMKVRKHGAADEALHEGRSGWTFLAAETLEGPLALGLRLVGFVPGAAVSFTMGALLSRFAWLWAGRASACSPEAVFSSQRGADRSAQVSSN